MSKLTKIDKIFYFLYTLIVVLFLIYDLTVLNLPYKIDIVFYFAFIFILNIYSLLKKNNTQ